MVALTALCKMLRWPKTCTCFVQNVNRNCLRPFYNRLVSLQVLELRMCIYSAACMMWVSYLQKNCMLIFKKKRIACKIIPLTWVFVLSPYLLSSCLLVSQWCQPHMMVRCQQPHLHLPHIWKCRVHEQARMFVLGFWREKKKHGRRGGHGRAWASGTTL